ncbi:glycoside hydrolase family 43 protein [uncultured Parabacteroides sp.]|uniref:glycoside hydrolase family 43 protein n=1 Tax=uncultured Parabacteroides sp. TaxID=512312 RepID=UPI0025DFC3EA|nr:glycoside hydrolase family 43 protein [uncultured Parabacteroides sp.]
MNTNILKKILFTLLWTVSVSIASLGEETVSTVLPIADPYILCYKDTYYAYGTSRGDGFDVYSSKDLKSWRRAANPALSKEDSYGDKWFWAPEVYYVGKDKKFYLFYSVEEHICVATSDSPLGPFVQDEKKPILEEKGIDTSVLFDEDGKAYLYFVRFTNGNVIWCVELKDNLKEIKEETLTQCIEATEPWETVYGKVAEGPSVIKRNGLYYLFYSANDYRSQDYAVGYATSASPFGLWKKSGRNPLLHKVDELVGTGHGAPFMDREGKYRYIFHAHKSRTEINQRNAYIVDMSVYGKDKVSIGGDLIRPIVVE